MVVYAKMMIMKIIFYSILISCAISLCGATFYDVSTLSYTMLSQLVTPSLYTSASQHCHFLCSILLSPLAKSSLVEMFDNIYIFNIALIF